MTVDLALFVRACAEFGEARPEYRFAPPRKWRFDLAWPELLVAFEREGGTWQRGRHTRPAGYANDAEKYNQAAIMGWIVIRGTADMIQSGLALDQLIQALAVRRAELNPEG
jgi:transposase